MENNTKNQSKIQGEIGKSLEMNRSLDIWQCMDIKCMIVRTDEKLLNVMMKVRLSWPRCQVVLALSLDVWPIFGKINAQLDIGTPTTEDSNHNIKSRSSWVGMIPGPSIMS